jgi:hypothetical protein
LRWPSPLGSRFVVGHAAPKRSSETDRISKTTS